MDWNDRQPIFVSGWPRSGNTWFLRLMSDLLQAPIRNIRGQEEDFRWCRGCEGPWAMVKTHRHVRWLLQERPRVISIVRDPRDVAVSRMFLKHSAASDEYLTGILTAMQTVEEPGSMDARGYTYLDFVEAAWDAPVPKVRYEDLHRSGAEILATVVQATIDLEITREDAAAVFERVTFDRCKQADPHFARKGIVGDWRSHFRQEHGRLITELMGDHLIERGYVEQRDWWQELPV